MLDGFRNFAGVEAAAQKAARAASEAWQERMRFWQSSFRADASVIPHEVSTLYGHSDYVRALTVLPSGVLVRRIL